MATTLIASPLQQAVAALAEAIAGEPAAEELVEATQRMLTRAGLGRVEPVPAYFIRGVLAMASGSPIPWTRVAEPEQGLGWLLCRFADVIPGTVSDETGAFDRLWSPALQRGIVVHRRDDPAGYSEWYAVEEVEPS